PGGRRRLQPAGGIPGEAPDLAGGPGGDVSVTDHRGRGFLPPEPRETFADVLERLPIGDLVGGSAHSTAADVERALAASPFDRTIDDFAALISPAASAALPRLVEASRALTLARFGRTMHMYAPLYLSNECLTTCVYCGVALELPIARKTLSVEETVEEAKHLLRQGFRSILLLTGEHER